MVGFDIQSILGLSVVAAIVSVFGNIVASVIKDFYFARSLDAWKRKEDLAQVCRKFQDPLLISAIELVSRVDEIVRHYPATYLYTEVFHTRPERQLENNIDDPYFRKTKLISTIFRFSCFLGWLELYRQEMTFLRADTDLQADILEDAISKIRSDLADGQLNTHGDWQAWHDTLIFREELRAIGESMFDMRGATRSIVGYGQFCELLEAGTPNPVQRWSPVVMNFFLDPDLTRKDFRLARLNRLLVHLVDLIEVLRPASADKFLLAARELGKGKLEAWKFERDLLATTAPDVVSC